MILGAIAVVAMLYSNRSQQDFGVALMVAGGVATALILAWNVLWVNLVLYRLTKEEVGP